MTQRGVGQPAPRFFCAMSELTLAVDFETTYDNVVSVRPLGFDAYFRHELFEAYLVAIGGSDGYEWVGHPVDAPWAELAEKYPTWISHNASFDESLYLIAKELGWWGDIPTPKNWHCSADLMAYLGKPRSLAGAVQDVLGHEMSKEVRDSMKGCRPPDSWPLVNKACKHHWKAMDAEHWDAVVEYATGDLICLDVWNACEKDWPEHERWLSDHTRTIARRGIPVDMEGVTRAVAHLKGVVHEFESAIPWRDTDALLSRAAFDRECLKHGLTPPKSLAKDDAEGNAWLAEHEDSYEWVHAFRNWRRANMHMQKVEAIERGTRKVGNHYRFFCSEMYCGAHTKRWSGGGGNLNVQNTPKGEMFGVNIRKLFKAPEGNKIAALDLSQIEVRTLTWLAKDKEMLDRIDASPDIYQAFAEQFGLWDPEDGVLKEVSNDLRQTVKPIVLGSGFGASAFAFASKERDQLQRNVREKMDAQLMEREGREFLERKLSDRRVGAWWWERASVLLDRAAMKDDERETAAGKKFTTATPAWKLWVRFTEELARTYERGATLPIDLDEWEWNWEDVCIYRDAEYCVDLYRSSMSSIAGKNGLWDQLKRAASAASMEGHLTLALPSGNSLDYHKFRRIQTQRADGTYTTQSICSVVRNGRQATMKPWYGLLAENLAQSLARDVFAYYLRKLEEAGFKILFHVHDEVVIELPIERWRERMKEAVDVMSVPPPWIETLPVAAEGEAGETYADCK